MPLQRKVLGQEGIVILADAAEMLAFISDNWLLGLRGICTRCLSLGEGQFSNIKVLNLARCKVEMVL